MFLSLLSRLVFKLGFLLRLGFYSEKIEKIEKRTIAKSSVSIKFKEIFEEIDLKETAVKIIKV